MTSIAVIGLYIAYVMPTFLRLRQGEDFKRGPLAPGPVELRGRLDRRRLGGDHHLPVHAAAGRARSPSPTFNYAVVAVLAVIGFAGIYWLVSARHWFKGPKVQGTAEELAAIEHELAS